MSYTHHGAHAYYNSKIDMKTRFTCL